MNKLVYKYVGVNLFKLWSFTLLHLNILISTILCHSMIIFWTITGIIWYSYHFPMPAADTSAGTSGKIAESPTTKPVFLVFHGPKVPRSVGKWITIIFLCVHRRQIFYGSLFNCEQWFNVVTIPMGFRGRGISNS